MGWVKLDDGFADHPKVIEISDGAFRLYVAALCHAARHLTDGYLAAPDVPRLTRARNSGRLVAELVTAKLWEPAARGYRVHNYLRYQRSANTVKQERQGVGERVARWRATGNGVRNGVGNAVTTPVTDGVTNAVTDGVTTPVTDGVTNAVTPRARDRVPSRPRGGGRTPRPSSSERGRGSVTTAVTNAVSNAVTGGVTNAVTTGGRIAQTPAGERICYCACGLIYPAVLGTCRQCGRPTPGPPKSAAEE